MRLTARQRAYIKKHSKYHEPDPSELDEELNIVPFLDIVVNLIMFLLMSVSTIAFFAQIEVGLPQSSSGRRGTRSEAQQNALNLTVSLTTNGILVLGSAGTLAPGCQSIQSGSMPTVPRQADGSYDFANLTRCLEQVKREFPSETKVKVAPDVSVAYGDFIAALDAVRATPSGDELFPEAQLVAGIR